MGQILSEGPLTREVLVGAERLSIFDGSHDTINPDAGLRSDPGAGAHDGDRLGRRTALDRGISNDSPGRVREAR